MSLDTAEVAEEPTGEVDHVYSLIDQLASAGEGRIGAPLAFVTDASPVAVAGAKEHQRTDLAGVNDLARAAQGRVKPVIVAQPHARSGGGGRGGDGLEFADVDGAGFLEKDMEPEARGVAGDFRE